MSPSLRATLHAHVSLPFAVFLLSMAGGCSPTAAPIGDPLESPQNFWAFIQQREAERIATSRSTYTPTEPNIGDATKNSERERGINPQDRVSWQAVYLGVDKPAADKKKAMPALKFELPTEHVGQLTSGAATDKHGACRYKLVIHCDDADLPVWEKVAPGTAIAFTAELDDPSIHSFTPGAQYWKKGKNGFNLSGLPADVGIQYEMVIALLHARPANPQQ